MVSVKRVFLVNPKFLPKRMYEFLLFQGVPGCRNLTSGVRFGHMRDGGQECLAIRVIIVLIALRVFWQAKNPLMGYLLEVQHEPYEQDRADRS